ncbi:MAG: hypothetical protein ACQES9_07835 [Myxococcota bacterium]
MHKSRFVFIFAIFLFFACDEDEKEKITIEEWGKITVEQAAPLVVLPSSTFTVYGSNFPDNSFGYLTVNIDGVFQSSESSNQVKISQIATWHNNNKVSFVITPEIYKEITGGELDEGLLNATLKVVAYSSQSGESYSSDQFSLNLELKTSLQPQLEEVESGTIINFGQQVSFSGSNLLLGGNEGETKAVISGCFLSLGQSEPCSENGREYQEVEVPISEIIDFDRNGGTFAFDAANFGVEEGNFNGEIFLRNIYDDQLMLDSSSLPVAFDFVGPEITRVVSSDVSLGSYLQIEGAGFAENQGGCITELDFQGNFNPRDGDPEDITSILIPEVRDNSHLDYVLEENQGIGRFIDLRKATGTLSGYLTPIICCDNDCQNGESVEFTVEVGPVKQVVYLYFRDSYVSALALFGLQGADSEIRKKSIQVIEEIYRGINLEVRTEQVTDYALFSTVEIHGFDPNGFNLLGYDNTTGKDVGNERLHDYIGGVNSQTQQDGFPGYGGVFMESYFGFSLHPPGNLESIDLADPLFDLTFDEFRPDTGSIVTAQDMQNFALPQQPAVCKENSLSRSERLGCAVYVMSYNLGSTLAHELGHSFGLAEPYTEDVYHNLGEESLRLMDSGHQRPFLERSGLSPEGFENFCISNYEYLRAIMPDPDTKDPLDERPDC